MTLLRSETENAKIACVPLDVVHAADIPRARRRTDGRDKTDVNAEFVEYILRFAFARRWYDFGRAHSRMSKIRLSVFQPSGSRDTGGRCPE